VSLPRPREDVWERLRRFRHGQRGWLLFLLSLPLLATSVVGLASGNLAVLGGAAVPWAMIVGGTILARRGFAAEAEGRPPPRRFRAWLAVLVGAGTGLAAAFSAGHNPAIAVLFGLGAAAGVRLLYGRDPRPAVPPAPEKPLAGDAAVLAAARDRIARLEAAAASVPQKDFAEAIARIASLARRIAAEAEADPADLRRARRYLTVYLEGAETVANRYVETHRGQAAPLLEENFRGLLAALEAGFAQQLAQLKETDARALDIDIAVLQQRLREEGMIGGNATLGERVTR
jgi:hypothetical protein